ncbi:hypothetical protein ACFLW3_01660 [Chloroflexota bacterium]
MAGLAGLQTSLNIISISTFLSVLIIVAIFYNWDKIQFAKSYGYLTSFLVSIIGGTLVIPISNMPVVFAMGNRLNPVFVGLISGLGEALGATTVYLAGVGGSFLWSRFRLAQTFYQSLPINNDPVETESKFRSRYKAIYKYLVNSADRWGGTWGVFITSAFLWWLSYPVALAAGTIRIGIRRFFLVSWAGKTIRCFIIAFLGYWGMHLLARLPWISQWISV